MDLFPKHSQMSSLSASRRFGHLLLSPAPRTEQGRQCLFYIWDGMYSPTVPQLPPHTGLLRGADGCAVLGICSGIQGTEQGQRLQAAQHTAWSIIRASGAFGLLHQEPQEQPHCSLGTRASCPGRQNCSGEMRHFLHSAAADGTGG